MHCSPFDIAANTLVPEAGPASFMSTARWSDRRYLDLAKVVGLSRFDLIRHVVLPQALHAVWTAVGSAFGIAAGLGARSKWTGHIDARPS